MVRLLVSSVILKTMGVLASILDISFFLLDAFAVNDDYEDSNADESNNDV